MRLIRPPKTSIRLNKTLPVERKRQLFGEITRSIAERLAQVGIQEEEILEDFEAFPVRRRRR